MSEKDVNKPLVIAAGNEDVAHCPKCNKPLAVSHSIGQLGDSGLGIAVFWCFECKGLVHFQLLGPIASAIQTAKGLPVF